MKKRQKKENKINVSVVMDLLKLKECGNCAYFRAFKYIDSDADTPETNIFITCQN